MGLLWVLIRILIKIVLTYFFREKKIVLKGNSTEHLQELFGKAKELNVPCYLVSDAGHTQIPAGSITVLSLFGEENHVNAITGGLNLL